MSTITSAPNWRVDVRPPCKIGDVFNSVEAGAEVIIMIDGYFEHTPAVWHKEVLYALERGVTVFGASSMGALRACELAAFGMIGVGAIYQQYATGVLEDDDEVAVSHLDASSGYQCVSDAMVSIRYGIDLAIDAQVLEAQFGKQLIARCKSQYYPLRNWESVFADAIELGLENEQLYAFKDFIHNNDTDLKAIDAREVLHKAYDYITSSEKLPVNNVRLNRTVFWHHLESVAKKAQPLCGHEVTEKRLLDHIKITNNDVRQVALIWALVNVVFEKLPLQKMSDQQAFEQFRYRHGLTTAQAVKQFLSDKSLSQQECLALAHREAKVRQVARFYRTEMDASLIEATKYCGQFNELMTLCSSKWESLKSKGLSEPEVSDVDDIDAVFSWLRAHLGMSEFVSAPQLIEELGFESQAGFVREMLAHYLSCQEFSV
ncbi:TfuA-like protein [Pseudoalteromonas rubra]|uniref:TfuA-like protein n=1 Tax=Pseudoalteromonas rubra TaxID=43658 RepID=UPI00138DDBEC|nr:TfuA-like protein [Pseudoalteromonas rubra]